MKKNYKALGQEQGNVIIEFTITAVALFVPISYISIAATQIATSYIEVQDAARAGARVFATSEVETSGKKQATEVIQSMFKSPANLTISFHCSKNPCLTKDGIVKVQIEKEVDLDLPLFMGSPRVLVVGKQAEVVQDANEI